MRNSCLAASRSLTWKIERSQPLTRVRVLSGEAPIVTAFLCRSSLTVIRKSASRKNCARVQGRNGIADPVDIGPNAHGYHRNREGFTDFERRISVRVKKKAEKEIGSKVANVRQERAGGHPSIQWTGNQRQSGKVVIARLHIGRAIGRRRACRNFGCEA